MNSKLPNPFIAVSSGLGTANAEPDRTRAGKAERPMKTLEQEIALVEDLLDHAYREARDADHYHFSQICRVEVDCLVPLLDRRNQLRGR